LESGKGDFLDPAVQFLFGVFGVVRGDAPGELLGHCSEQRGDRSVVFGHGFADPVTGNKVPLPFGQRENFLPGCGQVSGGEVVDLNKAAGVGLPCL
jgi:hypothetical protein